MSKMRPVAQELKDTLFRPRSHFLPNKHCVYFVLKIPSEYFVIFPYLP
jgi:hypothetical protein